MAESDSSNSEFLKIGKTEPTQIQTTASFPKLKNYFTNRRIRRINRRLKRKLKRDLLKREHQNASLLSKKVKSRKISNACRSRNLCNLEDDICNNNLIESLTPLAASSSSGHILNKIFSSLENIKFKGRHIHYLAALACS